MVWILKSIKVYLIKDERIIDILLKKIFISMKDHDNLPVSGKTIQTFQLKSNNI